MDACANPGTMFDLVIILESHGMSKLNVCVDVIVFPFGNVILIVQLASYLLTTGALSMRKFPVAQES